MAAERKIRLSRGDRWFMAAVYTLLTLIMVAILYPLVFIVSSSFSSTRAIVAGEVWLWPVELNLEGYKAVFRNSQISTGYLNSFIYMILGTSINLFLTIIAAYPLSRKGLVGRGMFMFLFTFTMLFQGGLIPRYLMVRSLGMLDTRWAMVIPNALAVWNLIITRTFFQTSIPDELVEASEMDGCSDIRFVAQVVLPLSGPIIAVMTLFYAISHWNSFFNALIYINTPKLLPLQIILRNILIQNQMNAEMIGDTDVMEMAAREGMVDLLKYSLIIVASAPLLAIYPFVQKYFVKGVMIGAIKG
jgi:multiple sugar transport system permease protein/putative aldouronate transport system permease protein